MQPAHIVPTVGLVKGERTSDETFEMAFALLERIRKVPVKINMDLPGLLVNRIQVAIVREVFDMYERGGPVPRTSTRPSNGASASGSPASARC